MANYTYQISLARTEAGIVTVLTSTSSLFTLFLAAFFPSNGGDKFTLSKLVAVSISILGLVCIIIAYIAIYKKTWKKDMEKNFFYFFCFFFVFFFFL